MSKSPPKVDISPIGFRLSGIEPDHDLAWWYAGPSGRLEFWGEAGRIGRMVKRRSLAAGLDRMGRKMVLLSGATLQDRAKDINSVTGRHPYSPMGRAHPKNPQLQATGARSRTRTLLTFAADRTGVWFYWGVDPHTGKDWGVILRRHSHGFFQRFYRGTGWVPARDVIGLSSMDLREIVVHMNRWWAMNRLRLGMLGRVRHPQAEVLAPEPERSPLKKPEPVRIRQPVRIQPAVIPPLVAIGPTSVFHSPQQESAYRQAVAQGRNLGAQRGGRVRTTQRLVKR